MTYHDHGDVVDGTESQPTFESPDSFQLTTVGIDIGSSTSHLVFSRLVLRRLGQYLSSRYVVVDRQVLYLSPILFTPYVADRIDTATLAEFIERSYDEAGIAAEEIDCGAVILTGEAVKRRNARPIAELFAAQAGKFVCASAGPNLEGIMAANGSGAAFLSRNPVQTVLNVDIGGGTSKLALVRDGEVLATAAINVGGRLLAFDQEGRVTRVEPAATFMAVELGINAAMGAVLTVRDRERIGAAFADVLLESIAGNELSTRARELLITTPLPRTSPIDAITFSGGVGEYIYAREQRDFGDLSPFLAPPIIGRIEAGELPAPIVSVDECIRATVIGAAQFTVQASGDTIAISRPDVLPLRNLPVLYPRFDGELEPRVVEVRDAIARSFDRADIEEGTQVVAISIRWRGSPRYQALRNLAEGVRDALPRTVGAGLPVVLVFANDVGKAVGEILGRDLGVQGDLISIDGIALEEFDFIDIGEVLDAAAVVPVVVKSLIFPGDRAAAAAELETIRASTSADLGLSVS
jgi:ethanolamine utilization protein EutA (predicted chaperonin)